MRFLIAVTILFLAGIKPMKAQSNPDICQKSLAVLKNAVQNGETFFIKVHAAENLIAQNQIEGLEAEFLQLQNAFPDYLIGSARVLARSLGKTYTLMVAGTAGNIDYRFSN